MHQIKTFPTIFHHKTDLLRHKDDWMCEVLFSAQQTYI